MVHPDLWGGGLGRALMATVIAHAAEAGIETLVLDVRGNNEAAIALYESLGWERYGVLPDFIAVGEDRYDRFSPQPLRLRR